MNAGFIVAAVIMATQLFLPLEAVPVGKIAEDTTQQETSTTYEEDNILFEGDISISIADIHKYYDLDEEMEKELSLLLDETHVSERAVTSYQRRLWINQTVIYEIEDTFDSLGNQTILEAIDVMSNVTCLKFVERSTELAYVRFIKGTRCSSSIGRVGRVQFIRLTTRCSYSLGIVLHEILHAIGLWHEQSRPDRDSYVTIHEENIATGKKHNFGKRFDRAVDYQGSEYDYGSVMHYITTAFANCSNCSTLNVNNDHEYENQGQPMLGQRIGLSSSDIIQINHLYKCPGPGQQGLLMLYIRYGHNIATKAYGTSDPYVSIKAISSTGAEYIKDSAIKIDSHYPTWNERLFFPEAEWQFFKIRVWDLHDYDEYDPRAMSVTVPLLDKPRTSNMNKYCINTACSGYILYDYKLLRPAIGTLQLRIREAPIRPVDQGGISWTQLVNTPQNIKVVAYSPSGTTTSQTLTTSNTWVTMKECSFAGLIRLEVGSPETPDPQFIEIPRRRRTYCLPDVSSSCSSTSTKLQVRLIPDGDECQPNPCLNGGTCTDGCVTYSCSCPDSFTGNRCQYRWGKITPYSPTQH